MSEKNLAKILSESDDTFDYVNIPTPSEIKEFLDNYVIGQESAKRTLSVAVYNHYKKILNNAENNDIEMDKSNVILLGETGSGKTLLVKTIAKMLGVPYYIQDCTKITASGYVGSDVEDCLVGLLRACDYDVACAEMGIIMLDEGDKIAKKEAGMSVTRDVSGECVQQSLLKIVEGDLVGVPPMGGRKHPEQSLIYVDTKNILFILSGAFAGIDKIVEERVVNNSIGFEGHDNKVTNDDYYEHVSPQDMRTFGFIPEFIGRFPVITNVKALTKEDLVRILKEPKNAIIKQFIKMLEMDNTELSFTNEALEEIAEYAHNLKTGARGLRNIVETILLDIMYEAPKNKSKAEIVKIEITSEYVKEKINNKIIKSVA